MKRCVMASVLVGFAGSVASAQTAEPVQVNAINGFTAKALVTVGEFVPSIDGGDY